MALPPRATLSPHLILLFVFLFLSFIAIPISSKKPGMSFDFPSFSSQQNLILLLGDAHIRNGTLFLTKKNPIPLSMSSGIALFRNPIPFQDTKTNAIAPPSFDTKFVFTITNYCPVFCRGNGDLTFFLSSSNINETSLGYSITHPGLFDPSLPIEDSSNLLTLEFDTRLDEEYDDPSLNHIRIHVFSAKSWQSVDLGPAGIDLESGLQYWVSTEYKHEKQRLEVRICYFRASNCTESILAANLNISDYFDHKHMYIGFSASTGEGCSETVHAIKKWGFRTKFQAHSSFSILIIPFFFILCRLSLLQ